MLQEEFIKNIEAENENFEKATKSEKRVIIAKDCIIRIQSENICAAKSGFLSSSTEMNFRKLGGDLKSLINSKVQCTTCAKGGLFLSYIGRVNNFKVCNIENDNSSDGAEHKKLLEIFNINQLALIEIAFEGVQYLTKYYKGNKIIDVNISYDLILKAKLFGDKYHDDSNKRLIAICKNIIKNKGTFKP